VDVPQGVEVQVLSWAQSQKAPSGAFCDCAWNKAFACFAREDLKSFAMFARPMLIGEANRKGVLILSETATYAFRALSMV